MVIADIKEDIADYIANNCKIDLYGLHYNTNWNEVFCKKAIIDALDINTNLDCLTDDEVSCLNSFLQTGCSSSGCGCSN